jgi:sec-independent protein translocase protein TatA
MSMPGGWELVLILAVALVLFGGGAKLANFGKGMGQGIRNFKDGLKEGDDESDKKDAKSESKSDKDAESKKA